MSTDISWETYVDLRRAATAASARALGQALAEMPGVISTAAPRDDAPDGSVFVHADPGSDALTAFVRSVNPSYIEVAGGTGAALATLLNEGCEVTNELAVMFAATTSVSPGVHPTGVSMSSLAMDKAEDLNELSDLLSTVESIPLLDAINYCTELGGLDDLRIWVARDSTSQVVSSTGVRCFGSAGLVMLVQTHPNHRRRGIAGALVAHALESAGITTAFLVATPSGRGVYERIGFRVVRPMLELAYSR